MSNQSLHLTSECVLLYLRKMIDSDSLVHVTCWGLVWFASLLIRIITAYFLFIVWIIKIFWSFAQQPWVQHFPKFVIWPVILLLFISFSYLLIFPHIRLEFRSPSYQTPPNFNPSTMIYFFILVCYFCIWLLISRHIQTKESCHF